VRYIRLFCKFLDYPYYGPLLWFMIYMLVVDAHSKRLEILPLSSTTTEKTLQLLWNEIY